ncbi:hypothetical protein [Nocardia brasiliensis]|uniref:hypothetical protein n=1 Tax=Nocardia brasiliensis TaxID=37326 RepID=UPI0004A6C13E|nr:hypothetical protein [Nocardia brasiliensis]
MTKILRALGILVISVAAAISVGTPVAQAEVQGIEFSDFTGNAVDPNDLRVGGNYIVRAVMGGQLTTYGFVFFFNMFDSTYGQEIGGGGARIIADRGRYVADITWSPQYSGSTKIKAKQCGESACEWFVNERLVPITVKN